MTPPPAPTPTKPPHPYLVLAAAIILPGSGHLRLGMAQRALIFLFFMLILGWLTAHFAPPTSSFIGRHAGGVFVYALSVLDAYKIARIRWRVWLLSQNA
jgi:hypothetical protein